MPLIQNVILAACASASSHHYAMCTRTAEASVRQLKLYDNLVAAERNFNKIGEKKAKIYFGQETVGILGVGFFVAQTVQRRNVNFGLPTLGLCDGASNTIGLDRTNSPTYNINLNWRFK